MHLGKFASIASLTARAVVAAAFVVASSLKLKDPATFAEQIGNYQMFPEFSNYLAAVLPCIEFTAGIALLLAPRYWRFAGATILATLLAVFTGALARAWALGINLECGCFGVGSTAIGIWPILRNLGLLSALALAVTLDWQRPSLATDGR